MEVGLAEKLRVGAGVVDGLTVTSTLAVLLCPALLLQVNEYRNVPAIGGVTV